VDHEYTHLVQGANIQTVISQDTGRPDDPYEIFLSNGRIYSCEMGWAGLEAEPDENAACVLCYTYVLSFVVPPQFMLGVGLVPQGEYVISSKTGTNFDMNTAQGSYHNTSRYR
jgi:hypothetical protein